MAGRVDQVEFVGLAVARLVLHADGPGLDGDPLLALEVHRVEDLAHHLALSIVCVSSSSRSASVVLPWSMWAMMEKLRRRSWGMVTEAAV